MSHFQPYTYLAATTRGLADASLPGAADDDGLPCPRPQSRASRSLSTVIGYAGFLTVAVGLPVVIAEYVR